MSARSPKRASPRLDLPPSAGATAWRRLEAARPEELADAADSAGLPPLHPERLSPGGGLAGCLACGWPELYTRKDFPPALGIGVVAAAAVLAPFTPFYASLWAAAGLDLALFRLAPDLVVCYACGARHRGFARQPRHPRFDRTIEERLRYGEGAVMGAPMRPGGTAGAPEPEH